MSLKIKSYNREELEKLSSENRVNYQTIIDSIARLWSFDLKIITSIVVVFHGSFDKANQYIEFMEGESVENPNKCWLSYYEFEGLDELGYTKNPPF